jgi:hypothetical protein
MGKRGPLQVAATAQHHLSSRASTEPFVSPRLQHRGLRLPSHRAPAAATWQLLVHLAGCPVLHPGFVALQQC